MTTGTSTLRDDFADNSEAATWSAGGASGSATKAETSGQARFTLPSSTAGSHQAYYRTAVPYDLTADSFYINIETMVATGVAATAFFELFLNATNKLTWTQTSGTLKAQTTVAGVVTDRYSAAWSGTTYKYLRIRESGGNILWDSSTNGTSWTNRASVAVSSLFAVTDLFIQFGASCGNVASPGSLRLDDVNVILPALTTNWNWTQVRWPVDVVHRNVTMAIDTAGTGQAYVVTADGVDVSNNPSGNVRYFSGPASDGRTLTEQSSEAAAKAMAVNIPLDGRLDLPELVQCRCVRVGHRSIDGNSYTIRELYPRRLVQSDDIEAEAIKAIHIGVIDLDADHRITAGRRAVSLDADGITILAEGDTYNTINAVTFEDVSGTALAYFYGRDSGGTHGAQITAPSIAGEDTNIGISAAAPATFQAQIQLTTTSPSGPPHAATITLTSDSDAADTSTIAFTADSRFDFNNAPVFIDDGLNVGTATGATAGQVKASAGIFPSSGTGSAQIQARDIANLANNGIAQLVNATGDQFGMVLVIDANNGQMALFTLRGGAHATQEISDPGAVYTNTAGSAASTNVYWSAANSRYEIENKIGSTQTYHVIFWSYS